MKFVYHGPDSNPHSEVELSQDDLLWLGRAYCGEHGFTDWQHCELFVWTMLNRFLLHKANRHWRSFKYMLRRFSQPVNPRWARGGDLALKNPKQATERHLRRREKISSLRWNQIPPEVRTVLKRFGGTSTPPWRPIEVADMDRKRVTNFAVVTESRKRRWPWGKDVANNYYFEDKRLRQGVVAIDIWSD